MKQVDKEMSTYLYSQQKISNKRKAASIWRRQPISAMIRKRLPQCDTKRIMINRQKQAKHRENRERETIRERD